MEFHVGDKFVVEIVQEFITKDGLSSYYRLSGMPEVLVNDKYTLADLNRYQDERAYKDGYNKGVEDSYKNGFEDGKIAAKVSDAKDNMSTNRTKGWEEVMHLWRWFFHSELSTLEEVFPDYGAYSCDADLVAQYGIPEVLSRVKAYEDKISEMASAVNADLFHYIDVMKEKYSNDEIINALKENGFDVCIQNQGEE